MKNMKVSVKLIVGFCIPIVLGIVIGILGLWGLGQLHNALNDMYYVNLVPLSEISGAVEYVQRLRVQTRNAVIYTGNAERLASVKQDVEDRENEFLRFMNAYGDSIVLDSTRKTFSETMDIFNSQYMPGISSLVANAMAGVPEEQLMEELETLNPIADSVRDNVTAMMQAKVDLGKTNNDDNEALYNTLQTVTICGLLFSVVVSIIFAVYISGLITKPLNRLASLVTDVISGNLNINMNRSGASKDEVGELTLDVYSLVDMIKTMTDDLNKISHELAIDGDIDYRIDTDAYKGAYKEMLDGVNELVSSFVGDVLEVLRGVSEVGKGNFDVETKKMPGKKALINENFSKLTATLKSIYADMTNLVNSAADGKLDIRVDAAKFQGGWGDILKNLNNLMQAIVSPIEEVNNVMGLVAEGDFSLKVTGNYKGDFLKIKNSINNTSVNLETYINEISSVLGALANDDLDQDIKREYVGKFSDIKEALLNIIQKFNGVIGEIYAAAEQVTAGAKQVSESSMTLAQGATEQASSVEELSATIQTINENTSQNAASAKEAEHLSDSSKTNAANGNENMQHMLKSMDGIKESSNDISKIIKVIEDIAFQTNLLALNAAVEAARAGEHGKGFAVVAEEVRNLASRSQTSAKDTSALIEESINRVNEGAKIAGETATALQAIVEDVTKVAVIITGISKASGDQSLAIGQVMDGVNQISTVVQSNSATSEESASASQELSSQADVMKGLVEVFKLKKNR